MLHILQRTHEKARRRQFPSTVVNMEDLLVPLLTSGTICHKNYGSGLSLRSSLYESRILLCYHIEQANGWLKEEDYTFTQQTNREKFATVEAGRWNSLLQRRPE